jgi:hypothetical protein
LALIDPDLKSLAFQMRKNFPPKYRLGPRNTSVLPRVSHVTNLITWSEDFSNVVWVKTNLSVVGSQADPFGGTGAFTLHENAVSAAHTLAQASVAVTAGDTYTFAVYAKQDNRNWISLGVDPGSSSLVRAWFDLNNGQIGQTEAPGPTIVVPAIRGLGGGWHRCSITFTIPTGETVADLVIAVADADGGGSFAGLDQDSVFAGFAHFDAWSVERAYVKTEATLVT